MMDEYKANSVENIKTTIIDHREETGFEIPVEVIRHVNNEYISHQIISEIVDDIVCQNTTSELHPYYPVTETHHDPNFPTVSDNFRDIILNSSNISRNERGTGTYSMNTVIPTSETHDEQNLPTYSENFRDIILTSSSISRNERGTRTYSMNTCIPISEDQDPPDVPSDCNYTPLSTPSLSVDDSQHIHQTSASHQSASFLYHEQMSPLMELNLASLTEKQRSKVIPYLGEISSAESRNKQIFLAIKYTRSDDSHQTDKLSYSALASMFNISKGALHSYAQRMKRDRMASGRPSVLSKEELREVITFIVNKFDQF